MIIITSETTTVYYTVQLQGKSFMEKKQKKKKVGLLFQGVPVLIG